MDCGEPASSSFFKTGLSYDAIDHIFISHLHFDHVGCLFMLIQSFWLKRQKKELVVHLPVDGIAPVRQLLNAGCIFDELLAFRLRFEPLRHGEAVTVGNVQVTPFMTTHLRTFRQRFSQKHPQNYEAFCFLIEAEGLRVGHTADVGSADDLAPLVAKPLDLLVCEMAHLNTERLFRLLHDCQIKRYVFIHLTQKQTTQIEQLRLLASQHLGTAELCFARDGEQIAF
jgi:ribonuclease BN (tRNA processing enzyme)